LEKCVFSARTIDFLGHRVTAEGVSPLPSHVKAVTDFPRPATVKELQGFLGLINFYRRFIPAAAAILKPLTDSLRGGGTGADRLTWSPEMQAAFEGSKEALAKTTLLSHPLPQAKLSLAVRHTCGRGVAAAAARVGRLGAARFLFKKAGTCTSEIFSI
jgi:hypothetical protein